MVTKATTVEPVRYHCLDVYKGICMIFIIITHYRWEHAERLKYLFPFWIDMAVPVLMVITGYLYSMSFQKKKMSIKEYYGIRELAVKWLRFMIPFIPVLLLELFAMVFFLHKKISALFFLKSFIIGGYGPGAYYFPVMFQLIVILPLLIISIRYYRFKGLLLWFVINFLFEAGKNLMDMSGGLYRLLSFRYLFVLAWGIWLYFEFESAENKVKSNNITSLYFIGGAGGVYLTVFNYMSVKPAITTMWTNTSMFAVLWIFPVMYWLIKRVEVRNYLLEVFGKASFDIFLIQMFYYWGIASYVYKNIDNSLMQLLFGLVFCLVFGVLYYVFESHVQRKVVSWIKSF